MLHGVGRAVTRGAGHQSHMESDLSLEFLRVVEQAAIACAHTMGQGDRHGSDRVAVEAMALKKPVIASRVGGLSEIVVDRKTGFLFSTEDSTALAKKMALIIQDKRLVKELGTLAYKRYQERFTLKKHIQEIEKIYQSISLTD